MVFTTLFAFLTMMLLTPARSATKMQQYPRLERAAQKDRVLIVAPHIDDEAIGAGGYAIDAIANGAEVYIVFLTAGDCSRFSARILNKTAAPTASGYLSVGRTRIAEAKTAMRLIGVPEDHFFVLGYPDRGLKPILDNRRSIVRSRGTREQSVPYADAMSPGATYSFESLMSDMTRVLEMTRPTTVIAPVAFDLHPDHSAAAEITDLALEREQIQPERLGYLVHMSRIPTWFVNKPARALLPPTRMQSYAWTTYPLSARVQQAKNDLLMTYKSQRPYVFMLRNAFVRTNELFFVQPRPAAMVGSPAPARLQIAR